MLIFPFFISICIYAKTPSQFAINLQNELPKDHIILKIKKIRPLYDVKYESIIIFKEENKTELCKYRELNFDFIENKHKELFVKKINPRKLHIYHADPAILLYYFNYLQGLFPTKEVLKNYILKIQNEICDRFCDRIFYDNTRSRKYSFFFSNSYEKLKENNEKLFPGYLYYNNSDLMFLDIKENKVFAVEIDNKHGVKLKKGNFYLNVTPDQAYYLVLVTYALEFNKCKSLDPHKPRWPMIACLKFSYPRFQIKNTSVVEVKNKST